MVHYFIRSSGGCWIIRSVSVESLAVLSASFFYVCVCGGGGGGGQRVPKYGSYMFHLLVLLILQLSTMVLKMLLKGMDRLTWSPFFRHWSLARSIHYFRGWQKIYFMWRRKQYLDNSGLQLKRLSLYVINNCSSFYFVFSHNFKIARCLTTFVSFGKLHVSM